VHAFAGSSASAFFKEPTSILRIVDYSALSSAVLFFVYLASQLIEKSKMGLFCCLEESADSVRDAVPKTMKHGWTASNGWRRSKRGRLPRER
jgi:hypothetical protein